MDLHKLREQVFKLIFSLDERKAQGVPEYLPAQVKNYLKYSCDVKLNRREYAYIYKKALEIGKELPKLDKKIDEVAKGWTTKYMGRAELSILRLSVFEILYDEKVPPKVAINEAIELAKAYCDTRAPSFINGILKAFMSEDTNLDDHE